MVFLCRFRGECIKSTFIIAKPASYSLNTPTSQVNQVLDVPK